MDKFHGYMRDKIWLNWGIFLYMFLSTQIGDLFAYERFRSRSIYRTF
jgi:hypothetical protein